MKLNINACIAVIYIYYFAAIQCNTKTYNTLIVVDKSTSVSNFTQSYSNLIELIENIGYKVTVKGSDEASLTIEEYGEYTYDNVLLFGLLLESTLRNDITVKKLLQFIDNGGNVLQVVSHKPGKFNTQLASELGFKLKITNSGKNYPNTKLNPSLYFIGNLADYPSKQVAYDGVQFQMLRSELTTEILINNAPVDDTRPDASSSKYINNVLIGAMQARNNARYVLIGSQDFFKFPNNNHLIRNLLEWVFKEKSLLRFSDVKHKKLNVKPNPSTDVSRVTNFEGYTINDEVEYSLKVEIYEDKKWIPYKGDDIQLELVRIDPFIRKTMTVENGRHVVRFKIPDVYGVYKFQVDYKKEGLTYLFSSDQVSVRPYRHNEYERYIYSAYPYYLSAFLMMIYVYIFSFVYLYQRGNQPKIKSA